MISDSPLVEQAAAFARRAHEHHHRKGGKQVPYFHHLESVARRLVAAGYRDPVMLASAYLHDVLEDQPHHGPEAREVFPADVMATVEVLSEQKHDASGAHRSKAERFEGYARGLEATTPAALRARVISCADKIDNTDSLLDPKHEGHKLLLTLSTRPGQHRRQFERLRPIYAATVNAALLAEFDRVTADFAAYLARWLPGRAVAIAAAAHLGQFDKAGEPYITHPLRLFQRAATSDERIVAVLHDLIEDTDWTLAALADEGFSPVILAALDALTRRSGESYDAFLDRVLADPLATRVKRLDLEDNLNAARLPAVGPADLERLGRYVAALARVRAHLAAEPAR
jgi:(p)ppGpp synthase/HD superfamily hydrolase